MSGPEVRPRITARILNRLRTVRRAIADQFRETPQEFDPIEYVDQSPPPEGPARFRRGPSF